MQPDGTGSAGGGANARPPPVTAAPAPSGRPVSVLPHKTANVRDHYRIGKKLGQGQFGTTYLCVAKEDGAEFACKSIPKRKLLCREDYEDAWREIQIMHHLSEHPNVVRIRAAYEDALFVHIVMELCAGGELFDRIVAKGHYTERAAAQLIRTIVGVVEGCHSLGVMHRDLKPENFLFASTAEDAPLKTTDFGLSMFYKPGDKFSDVVGSPYYVAPEVLQKCYGPEADVWSAGVILYILLCGVPPFWAETEAGIFRQILRGKLDFESEPWPSISDSAKDLVRNMLCRDPTKRLSAHEVLCHPWIVDDAVAPDKPIDSAVLSRLKHFSAMNKLKKMALRVIAESLSEEEIGGLKELFKMIDADNSGTITFDELKDGLKRVGSELTEHEIQALMDAADIDNSGTIDYGEFIAATLHMNKLEREENLVSAFEFFDKDGSGFITIDELSQACSHFGLDDVHLEDMIKDVDQNNDGQIDYSEFAAMMRKGNAGAAGRRTMRNSLQLNLGDSLCRSNPVRCPAPPEGFSTSLVPIPSCISSSKAIFMELSPISASLGAMGSLPGKLGELLATRHWALRGVVMDEIEQLTNDLHTLQNFLVKLSNAQDPPMTARYWMKNVRELTYDMVDCVDQFVHADARAKIRRATRRNVITRLKINRLPERWKWRPWITNKISEFRTCAQEATQRYWRYRFDACACNPGYSPIGQDLPNIVPDPDDLVGIEGPMNQLERWLTSGDEQLKVVSIVGVAGIGKTTLAQKLWGKLHGQFECRAFVRAGQKPDMRGVIRSILSQVRRHQPPGPGDMHHLICDLREYLQDKRYFVIIDELWTTSVWDVFSRAFPEGNCCSRIIITTEIVEVALACCGFCPEHILKMESLSDDDSEKLLLQRMLVSENQQFDNVLPQIMRNCGGLPLAIIIVASILACQPEKLEQLGCLHDSFGANHTMEGFMGQILNITFNSLPHHLKTCLLYLSTYPEGFLLLKGDLVKQWVAEGFICVKEGEDMEEVAGSYFDELVSMGLIQAMDINYDYELLSYTVHHMVLDCITYKSIEHNFVTVVDYSQTTVPVTDKVRRLSLHFGSATYASTPRSTRLPQVRSLFFSGLFNCMPSFMVFKLLQVLILHFWCDTGRTSVNLSGICELFRLRYLQVTCNVVVKLPDQIEDMKNLQTLEINAEVWDLPPDIVRLSSLLHLRVQGGANLPDGIGSMKSLRTLMYFDLGNNFEDNIWGLAELTNLRDLHLTYSSLASGEHLKRNLMVLAATLRKLSNLKSLTLTASTAGTVVLFDDTGGMSSASVYLEKLELLPPICIFSRLPKWTRQLHKLRILEVAVRELLRDDIDSLTGLHFLTVFSLCIHTAPERRIVFNDGAFPVLKYFKFRCGVLCLGFMAGAMPNLRRLKLAFNMTIRDKYGDMLAGIEHLVNLQDITSQIGASTDSVRRAVEAVFKDAIGKHPMCPRFSIQWVQPVEEEYLPSEKQHLRQEKYSPGENYGVLEKAGDMNKRADNKISQISDLPTTVASSSLKSVELSIKHHVLEKMLFDESAEPESLELSLLEDITTNFSNDHEIGRNRFGVVYKGNLPNGRIVVVKRLAIAIDDKVFLDGVDCLMSVKHRNIVRFLGYSANIQENVTKEGGKSICIGMHDRFLCFEYLCNGNLRMHLDDESLRFDWHMRYQVINGICQGLHYLHDNCITHLDLKLDNILFDDKMVPKIVDCGYSRLWNEEICPIVPRNIGGSLAYMATPEYFGGGPITLKSDIFSLGVIIMQIVFGQYELNYSSIPSVLESWRSRLESDASERHISTETCYQQVKVCLDIGISCMNHDPENRCITQDIIHRLAKNEIVELSVRSDVGNSYLEQMTVHCKEIFKPFAKALLAPPVHHKILNKHLEQRIVISVWMQSDKARDLAIRLVARTKGVKTVTVTSKSKNRLEVVGEDVDVVALVMLLRRKVGHAEIVTEDHVEVAENLAMGDEIEMIPKFGDWSEPSYFTVSGTNFKSFSTVDESGRSDDTGCTIS